MRHFSGWMRPPRSATWVAFICALLGMPSVQSQVPQQAPQAAPPRPIVRAIDVEYTGPATVSKERILAQMRTKVGQPFNDAILEQDVEALYKGGGVQNVHIFGEPQGDGVKVIVQVQTRLIAREIVIEGSERIKAQKLRKEIKLKLNQPIREEDLEEAREKIIEVYQSHGFTDVRRERNAKGKLIITIVIAEGPQYHVRNLTISGEKVAKEEALLVLLKMKAGSVYSPKELHDDAKAVADAYGSSGYVDLVITPESTPAGPGLVDVHYKIEEGERSYLNRVDIEGNTRTKDKVIRREVLVAPGDVFNTVRVDTTKKRLENLGYFSKVETYPEDTGVPGRKDLTILVQEKRTVSLSLGGGFSTVEQLVGTAELTQGNFDLFNWPSFTGGGQKFRLRLSYGSVSKNFLLNIVEPYFLDRRLSLSGSLFYSEADYLSVDYNQRNYGFSFEFRKPLTSLMYASLGYQLQNVDIYNVSSSAPPDIQLQQGTFTESKIYGSLVL